MLTVCDFISIGNIEVYVMCLKQTLGKLLVNIQHPFSANIATKTHRLHHLWTIAIKWICTFLFLWHAIFSLPQHLHTTRSLVARQAIMPVSEMCAWNCTQRTSVTEFPHLTCKRLWMQGRMHTFQYAKFLHTKYTIRILEKYFVGNKKLLFMW